MRLVDQSVDARAGLPRGAGNARYGAAAMNANHPAYPLRRDHAEHQRLAMQAAFWAADAEPLFAPLDCPEVLKPTNNYRRG